MSSQPTLAPRDRRSFPSAGQLREIAARDGIDNATSLLYRCLLESPKHGTFIQRIEQARKDAQPSKWPLGTTLVVVPGAFYREHPNTGADGRLFREQAELLGCSTGIIPVHSTGTLQQNSAIICDWLLQHPEQPVILASLSKGGADIKMALARPEAARAFRRVVAWINLCGMLNGTPMAEWLLSWNVGAVLNRLYYRLRGWDLSFIRDLQYGPGFALDFALNLPSHVRLISIVGFPLRKHLSNGIARRCHRRLTALGPNDGGLVLAEVCSLPGLVYPVWGADHYLRPEFDVRQLITAVLQYLAQEVQ